MNARESLLERLELISRRGSARNDRNGARPLDAGEARVAHEWITELTRQLEVARGHDYLNCDAVACLACLARHGGP